MAVYAGIDLHSTNSYVAMVDEGGKKVYKKKVPNDGSVILAGARAIPGRAQRGSY